MQAVLNRVENKFTDILNALEYVDNNSKNELENNIVNMGSAIVECLVKKLKTLKGLSRGVVAMSLIRIGECAIAPLRREAMKNAEFAWIADYLITEIECGH